MSKIIEIRTIRVEERSNIIWVEIETDEGLVGLGEAFRGSEAIEAIIHSDLGKYLIGQDSRKIAAISKTLLNSYVGFNSSSSEVRAASAIDIALWDLFGQRNGIPVHEALGGCTRDTIRVYNTCSGYSYNSTSSSYNFEKSRRTIGTRSVVKMKGPYDDQIAFMQDPAALAKSLISEGYSAMKIWPFDIYVPKSQGTMITLKDLEQGLLPFQKIRDAVGDKIEIMCDLHSLWTLPATIRICQALEEYNIFWAEDPIAKMDDAHSLNHLRRKTNTPICGSETLAGAATFRRMIENGSFDYVMIGLSWCGGLTEARKIAAIAESYSVPVTTHECTGPIVLWASLHLALHASTGLFQEVVRANLSTWYNDFVDALPPVEDGYLALPSRPGIGARLKPEVKERDDAIVRVTGLQ